MVKIYECPGHGLAMRGLVRSGSVWPGDVRLCDVMSGTVR